MKAIFKRELYSLYTTPQGYVFSGAFILVMNVFFHYANITGRDSDLGAVFTFMLTVLMFTVPVLTMRGFSEEYRWGTDRLIFTAPIKPVSIVAGKFLAMLTAFGGTLFISTLIFAEIIALFGALNFSEYLGHMVAILTFAAVYIALGLFISALTSSQMLSMLMTLGAFVLLLLFDVAAGAMPDSAATRLMTSFSLFRRYDSFSSGLFSVADLVFVVTCCGFFLLLTAAVLHRRRHGLKGQKLRMLAVAVPALAVLVLANVLCNELDSRFYLKYDMTRSKAFALSQQTLAILEDLPEPVTITLLTRPEDMAGVVIDEDTGVWYPLSDIRECLEKYSAIGGSMLTLRYVDPDLNPNWIRERDLTEQAGYYSIVIESERRARVINLREMFETQTLTDIDGEALTEAIVGLTAERTVTSAILNVITEKLPRAVVLSGHGEYPAEYLQWILTTSNYTVEEINLTHQEIPNDTELVILAAPIYDFNEKELTALDKYLSGGGNAIIGVDPSMPQLDALELYFEEWGIGLESAYVFDAELNYGRQDLILPALDMERLEGMNADNGRFLLVMGSRPISVLWEVDGNRVTTSFMSSYDTAYAKDISADAPLTSLDEAEGDMHGPFDLGVVSQQMRSDGSGSMVVFLPVSVFADEALSMQNFLNYYLMAHLLSQAQSELSLDLPPRDITTVPLSISSAEAFWISLTLLVVVPLLPAVGGVLMWFSRKKL